MMQLGRKSSFDEEFLGSREGVIESAGTSDRRGFMKAARKREPRAGVRNALKACNRAGKM
eukprot:6175930-Pleurochrysis_carterae.AAC.3